MKDNVTAYDDGKKGDRNDCADGADGGNNPLITL
jgi:hypothetical protein